MSTRGAIGFRKDGVDKVTYNHCDSYPTWLGAEIIKFIKSNSVDDMLKAFDRIKLVDSSKKVTKKDEKELSKYGIEINRSVGTGDDWYSALRNVQGDLSSYIKGLPYMIDSHHFLADSLFCEYAYIINLDSGRLEFYQGFNKKRGGLGRYAELCDDDEKRYYGVTLFREVPLDEVRLIEDVDAYVKQLEADMSKAYEEENKEEKE